MVCFSVEKTPLVEEIYIDFTQDPDSYWTDPKPITKVAINGLYVARSLYNITKISTVRALVKLTVGGYVPANSTVAIRIAENNFTTPVFAHSTACGSLYGIGGGTRPDSLALFVRIGGVILAIVLLVFTFVDFSRGSIFQRSLLLDIMLHLRFVNIRPPGDLRQFFYYARTSNIAVVLPVNMFSSLGEQDQQVLPTNTKFHQYSTDTQFCLSFGIELGSLIVLVVLQMLFGLLSKLELDKISALGGFFRHCNRIFNCNLAMNLLLAYSLRAFIYILLNFRFLQLSSGLGMASFMLAVLMLLVYIILLGYTSTFIYKRRSAYLRGRFKGGDGALVLEWDYIQDSWLQRGYPVLSLVRSIVTAVILVFGQDNGLVQLVLLLSIQLFYLVYLSHQLPHRHGVDFAGQMIGEFMLVMILTSMFALESLNRYNYLNVQPGNTAAWICMMAIFMYVLYLLLQLMYELYLAWQKLGVYLARVERRQWKEEQQADEDVIIAQTLKGLFLAVLEYSASDPMPSSINSITDRTARELLQKQQEERFQAQEKIRAEEQARERAREQARNTTRARKALRQAFEWEVQNKVLDEMLDEVEDINIKKAEQTKIGIAEAESPDKAEQPSQNRLKSQSIRVKPAPSQGLDMSAKQWKEAAKLTDKVIQKANAQQRREKLRSKSLVREETRLPPQQSTLFIIFSFFNLYIQRLTRVLVELKVAVCSLNQQS